MKMKKSLIIFVIIFEDQNVLAVEPMAPSTDAALCENALSLRTTILEATSVNVPWWKYEFPFTLFSAL